MGLFDKFTGKKTETTGMKGHVPAVGTGKAKDPVCGMDIDPKTAAAKSEYMGQTYYFCALACKKSFDANPAKYVGGGQPMAGHGGH